MSTTAESGTPCCRGVSGEPVVVVASVPPSGGTNNPKPATAPAPAPAPAALAAAGGCCAKLVSRQKSSKEVWRPSRLGGGGSGGARPPAPAPPSVAAVGSGGERAAPAARRSVVFAENLSPPDRRFLTVTPASLAWCG